MHACLQFFINKTLLIALNCFNILATCKIPKLNVVFVKLFNGYPVTLISL